MSEEIVVGQVVEVVEDRVAGLPERFSRIYTSEAQTNYQSVASLSVSHSEDGYLYSDIDSPYPLIEQMEGASVSAVAEQLGVEFLHLRAISNRVGDPFAMWEIGKACEALAEALTKL
jgi:adenosylhomocysteine nucleosidase/futalosine hydrolase